MARYWSWLDAVADALWLSAVCFIAPGQDDDLLHVVLFFAVALPMLVPVYALRDFVGNRWLGPRRNHASGREAVPRADGRSHRSHAPTDIRLRQLGLCVSGFVFLPVCVADRVLSSWYWALLWPACVPVRIAVYAGATQLVFMLVGSRGDSKADASRGDRP